MVHDEGKSLTFSFQRIRALISVSPKEMQISYYEPEN